METNEDEIKKLTAKEERFCQEYVFWLNYQSRYKCGI
jgi:hypothetical protein